MRCCLWIDTSVVLAGGEHILPSAAGHRWQRRAACISRPSSISGCWTLLDPADKNRARSLACARDLLAGQEAERLAAAPVGQFDPGSRRRPGLSRFGGRNRWSIPGHTCCWWKGHCCSLPAPRVGISMAGAGLPSRSRSTRPPRRLGQRRDGEESRGEVWVPVWKEPFTLAEIRQLFGEARASWRGRPAGGRFTSTRLPARWGWPAASMSSSATACNGATGWLSRRSRLTGFDTPRPSRGPTRPPADRGLGWTGQGRGRVGGGQPGGAALRRGPHLKMPGTGEHCR